MKKYPWKSLVTIKISSFLKLFLVILLIGYFFLTGEGLNISKAKADLTHSQIFPHTKVMMIDYMHSLIEDPVLGPQIKEFMATHYDAIISGGRDLINYSSNPPPQFRYTNYYCMYVKEDLDSEYQDAKNVKKELTKLLDVLDRYICDNIAMGKRSGCFSNGEVVFAPTKASGYTRQFTPYYNPNE